VDSIPQPFRCPYPIAEKLTQLGYSCHTKYWQNGQTCWVFQRDPWEPQVTVQAGEFNNRFAEYCETGNTDDWTF
jgi:hypothetical protein